MRRKIVFLAIVFAFEKISILSFATELEESAGTDYIESEATDEIIVDVPETISQKDISSQEVEDVQNISPIDDENTDVQVEEAEVALGSQLQTESVRGLSLLGASDEEQTSDENSDESTEESAEEEAEEVTEEDSTEEECEHSYIYISNDDGSTHTVTCENCDYEEEADCVDEDDDGSCDYCEQLLVKEEKGNVPTGIEVVIFPFILLLVISVLMLGLILHSRRTVDEA